MAMKFKLSKIYLLILLVIPALALAANNAGGRNGYILLQVEENGEAWYVFPTDGHRYYLGRPLDAFAVMRSLSLGATHELIAGTEIFPERLSGRILLDVEKNGEAYYIYPKNRKKYYLGRPEDAFRIMRELGQGIANSGLINIPIEKIKAVSPATPITSDFKILQNVPFTSQAPYGGWSDIRQEDGCEEASSLMAVSWAQGKTLTAKEALAEILGASDYIEKKYKEYRDISPVNTLNWIIKDYFNYDKAAVIEDISLEKIIAELKSGHIIIAPMNGQILNNPNYTAPGPPNHMLVIRGYDAERRVFITNDPGTRHGEAYEYDVDLVYKAIRTYPTGYHEPNKLIKKDVIIVWK